MRLLGAPGGEVVAGPDVGGGEGPVVLGGYRGRVVGLFDLLDAGRRELVGGSRVGSCCVLGGRRYGDGGRGDGCGLPEWGEQTDRQDQGERQRQKSCQLPKVQQTCGSHVGASGPWFGRVGDATGGGEDQRATVP